MRVDGRNNLQLRPVQIRRNFSKNAHGSALVEFGDTHVLCTAMVEDRVPPWLYKSGKGWVSAEYAMLPGSTPQRKSRDRGGNLDGRVVEIQRLIGRSLRGVINMEVFGERTIWVDCDVLQADGGTRTAAITGAYVALCDAVEWLRKGKNIQAQPITGQVAAVSVGMCHGEVTVDLCYSEDVAAEVDMNVAMLATGQLIEVQGTGEHRTFSRKELDDMLVSSEQAIRELFVLQNRALGRA